VSIEEDPVEQSPDETDKRDREPLERDAAPSNERTHRFGVAAKIGVIIACGALGYGFAALTANMELQSEIRAFGQSRTNAIACVQRYESVAKEYGDKDVDEHLSSDLEDACKKALRLAGVNQVTPTPLDALGTHESAEEVRKGTEALKGQEDTARDFAMRLREDHYERILANARKRLGSIAANAKGLAESSKGKVTKDSLRTALEGEAALAGRMCKGDALSPTLLDAELLRVQSKADAVESSKDAWEREQAERRTSEKAARRAAASSRRAYRSGGSGGASRATGGNCWNVSYRGTDDPSSANADGSTSRWADGYYIAHSWSAGGKEIASKPSTVTVDGRTYRYVSSEVVSRDADANEVLGYARQNGGIGFQTCSGGGYLVTHYEPVG
jgi:hypothetical protein